MERLKKEGVLSSTTKRLHFDGNVRDGSEKERDHNGEAALRRKGRGIANKMGEAAICRSAIFNNKEAALRQQGAQCESKRWETAVKRSTITIK